MSRPPGERNQRHEKLTREREEIGLTTCIVLPLCARWERTKPSVLAEGVGHPSRVLRHSRPVHTEHALCCRRRRRAYEHRHFTRVLTNPLSSALGSSDEALSMDSAPYAPRIHPPVMRIHNFYHILQPQPLTARYRPHAWRFSSKTRSRFRPRFRC